MRFNFTIKGDKNKGIDLVFHEWAFSVDKKANENKATGSIVVFELFKEDDSEFYKTEEVGKIFIKIPEFEDLGIDEANYEKFKAHIIENLPPIFA